MRKACMKYVRASSGPKAPAEVAKRFKECCGNQKKIDETWLEYLDADEDWKTSSFMMETARLARSRSLKKHAA